MSEKEIKKTDVVGKNVEDLTEEELAEVQGQGSDDVTGETVTPVITNIGPTAQVVTRGIIFCKKK